MSIRLIGFEDSVLSRRVYECLARWLNFSDMADLPDDLRSRLNFAGQVVAKAHLSSGVSESLAAKAVDSGSAIASHFQVETPADLEGLAITLSTIRRNRDHGQTQNL